jgi:hypothetical protein
MGMYGIMWQDAEYRRKKIYGELREYQGEIFHELVRQKEIMCQQPGGMKRQSRSISGNREQKTNDWNSWSYSKKANTKS